MLNDKMIDRCHNLWDHVTGKIEKEERNKIIPFFRYRLGRDESSRGIHYGEFSQFLRKELGINPQMRSVFFSVGNLSDDQIIQKLRDDRNINTVASPNNVVTIFDTVDSNGEGGIVSYFAVLTKHLADE